MNSIKLDAHVGPDGTLRLDIPVGLADQDVEVDALNERLAPFRILKGIEVNIRIDGSLTLPDEALAERDWVLASLHAAFDVTDAYLRFPDLHDELITFVAEDDVWLAPIEGGRAWRVTADQAGARGPRFSPARGCSRSARR